MKMLLAGILTLMTVTEVFAVTDPMQAELERILTQEGKSHFEALGRLLLAGNKTPSLEKLNNVALSGRCFGHRSQNEAINSGFLIRKQGSMYKAFLYNEVHGDAAFFDDMTIQDIFSWNPSLTSVEIDESFFAVERVKGFSSFEQYGQYLIEEQTTFVKVPGSLFEKWVTTAHCYYQLPKITNSSSML